MRDLAIFEDRRSERDDKAVCRGAEEEVLDLRALGGDDQLVHIALNLREWRTPGQTCVDELLTIQIAQDDGIGIGVVRYPGL